MRENEMIQTLKQEVEIPEIVQHKADEAFIKIKTEATQKKNSRFTQRTKHNLISRSGIAVALVAILAASTFTAGAAAHSIWSNALLTDMDISEEQKSTLEQSDMVDIVNQTATDAGVTITVEQTIADENFAYIAFKIEGYDLPDGAAPAIEETKITVGGHMVDCFGYFYDGIVWDENGSPIMADGSEVQYDETGALVGQYAAEDGSLEYICIINARYLSDYFNPSIIGKTIYAEFQNLGTCISNAEDASYDSTIEAAGHWNLSWTLQGTTDIYHYEFEEELGNSGITLVSADITPISIKTAYSYSTPRDPSKNQPYIALKMQDGTIISPNGPGNVGTMFPYNNIYADRTAFNQIIDPAEISALLFFVPDGIENGMQQYQRYEIPVKDNDNTQ